MLLRHAVYYAAEHGAAAMLYLFEAAAECHMLYAATRLRAMRCCRYIKRWRCAAQLWRSMPLCFEMLPYFTR